MRWLPRQRAKDDTTRDASEARERAERDLTEIRNRREKAQPLLAWLREDRDRNHYGERVASLFQGRDQ